MVGTEDPYFLYQNYTEIPFGEDSVLTYLNKILSRVLACQGLTKVFTKNETPLTHTYIFNQAQSGNSSRPYLFTLIKGMTHMYANGNNFPIETARLFWEFFKQSTPVNTADEIRNKDLITAFPNPSDDKIEFTFKNLRFQSPLNIRVINILGQIIYSVQIMSDDKFLLEKSQTGGGLFTLQIQCGNQYINKKFIFD
jgi:hypothetical protein